MLLLDDNLDQSISEAFAAGASDVICQPCVASELIARVDATRQRLQLWNDVESFESSDSPAASSTTLRHADRDQPHPHFRTSLEHEAAARPQASPTAQGALPLSSVVDSEQTGTPQIAPLARTMQTSDWLLTHDLPHGIKPPVLDRKSTRLNSSHT